MFNTIKKLFLLSKVLKGITISKTEDTYYINVDNNVVVNVTGHTVIQNLKHQTIISSPEGLHLNPNIVEDKNDVHHLIKDAIITSNNRKKELTYNNEKVKHGE